MKYNLIQRRNLRNEEAEPKWYAVPMSERPLSGKAVAETATENTSTTSMELESSFELMSRLIPQQLRQGHTVKIPYLGSLRLSFNSSGCENIDDFRASTMIKRPRIIFTPTPELRKSVIDGLTFENGGVIEDKIGYASVADYHKAKGSIPTAPEEDEPIVQ